MPRSEKGRALFLHRDSAGRSDLAPPQYVAWATREAKKHGVKFNGTEAQISSMIENGISCQGDIYLDYGIPGDELDRPGLNGLMKELANDTNVSHVFIHRRDRLARPENYEEGIAIENKIRSFGITLVYSDKVLTPLKLGESQNLGEAIVGTIEFHDSGKFRRELSEKLTMAKVGTANRGASAGGPAPYGFDRWLVCSGKQIRVVPNGERVKIKDHWIVHLPTNKAEMKIRKRILRMIKTHSAKRIAEILTREGVPPPSRSRRVIRGVWHATTVKKIVADSKNIALSEFGQYSSGKLHRFTKDGPRKLGDQDRSANNKPKRVPNPRENWVVSKLDYPLVVPETEYHENLRILDERAGKLHGLPRERGESYNPLGCRIIDIECGWIMYRDKKKNSFGYKCALYNQTKGQLCKHNTVSSDQAIPFVLDCIRQRILERNKLDRLKARVRELIEQEHGVNAIKSNRNILEKEHKKLLRDIKLAGHNLARCKTNAQRHCVQQVFDELDTRRVRIEEQLKCPPSSERGTVEAEVEAAIARLQQLNELAADPNHKDAVSELIACLNVKLYVRFVETSKGRRKINKLIGGMVTFGSKPPPVPIYQGPTGLAIIHDILAKGEQSSLIAGKKAADSGHQSQNGSERVSLRKLNCVTPLTMQS